jgi:hypothetical protein
MRVVRPANYFFFVDPYVSPDVKTGPVLGINPSIVKGFSEYLLV